MAELPRPITESAVDRWIFDRILADPSIRALARAHAEPLSGTRAWHDPERFDLVLLPTSSHWLAPAWLGYSGEESRPEFRCAAHWQWHRRFGAELVASWDTVLQFVVERPPTLSADAWDLAGQLLGVGRSLQVSQWLQAVVVADSPAWFLHDRP